MPCSVLRRPADGSGYFQTAQGWSWPVARHSSKCDASLLVMTNLGCPGCSTGCATQQSWQQVVVVSSSAVASRKLLLDLSRFWGAESFMEWVPVVIGLLNVRSNFGGDCSGAPYFNYWITSNLSKMLVLGNYAYIAKIHIHVCNVTITMSYINVSI